MSAAATTPETQTFNAWAQRHRIQPSLCSLQERKPCLFILTDWYQNMSLNIIVKRSCHVCSLSITDINHMLGQSEEKIKSILLALIWVFLVDFSSQCDIFTEQSRNKCQFIIEWPQCDAEWRIITSYTRPMLKKKSICSPIWQKSRHLDTWSIWKHGLAAEFQHRIGCVTYKIFYDLCSHPFLFVKLWIKKKLHHVILINNIWFFLL